MFRNVCKLCQVAHNKTILNLRKYTVTSTLNTYINIFPNDNVEEIETETKKKSNPIIVCKRKEFNHYPGTVYTKFDTVPIASSGWSHYKSKEDYFTINPIIENEDDDEEHENIQFEDFGIDRRLIDKIKERGIKVPTMIQKMGIPEILDGQNTIIQAETGCGKTLTYLLPILSQILKCKSTTQNRPANSPLAVIITPSQELTTQIAREIKILTKNLDVSVRTLTGGRTKKIMTAGTLRNVDILVGTLGVTSKLTAVRLFKLNYVQYTVIDEAHALFDETFDEKMRVFLRRIKFGFKQTTTGTYQGSLLILASATMPNEFPDYLSQSVDIKSLVNIATRNSHRVLVPQKFIRLGEADKPLALLKLIKSRASKKLSTIIFSNSSATSDWISIFLNQMNIKTISLNSQMKMHFRKDKFRMFQLGEVNILSTTNAGARGLDTTTVDCVINYDFPLNTADYVHRCGRTGRVGGALNGRVINFVTKPLEIDLVQKLERAIRRNKILPMFDIGDQKCEKKMSDELESLMNVAKNM